MSMGCSPSQAVNCVDLSTQFYFYKAQKINCLVSSENSQNDRTSCIENKENLFKKDLREYLQPYYQEAIRFDNYLKAERKAIKTNIPLHQIRLCSPFCINLRNKMNSIFHSRTFKVNKINTFYKNKISEYSMNLRNNMKIINVPFPEECRSTLQNLRHYNFETENKKDEYSLIYQREYMDCLRHYTKRNTKPKNTRYKDIVYEGEI